MTTTTHNHREVYAPARSFLPKLNKMRCAAAILKRTGHWPTQCSFAPTFEQEDSEGVMRGWCTRHGKDPNS